MAFAPQVQAGGGSGSTPQGGNLRAGVCPPEGPVPTKGELWEGIEAKASKRGLTGEAEGLRLRQLDCCAQLNCSGEQTGATNCLGPG